MSFPREKVYELVKKAREGAQVESGFTGSLSQEPNDWYTDVLEAVFDATHAKYVAELRERVEIISIVNIDGQQYVNVSAVLALLDGPEKPNGERREGKERQYIWNFPDGEQGVAFILPGWSTLPDRRK